MRQSVILIPAPDPGDKLKLYVQGPMQKGFSYIIVNDPDIGGIITVDADGQHPVKVFISYRIQRRFVFGEK